MEIHILKKAQLILDLRSLCLPVSKVMTDLKNAGLESTDLYQSLEGAALKINEKVGAVDSW